MSKIEFNSSISDMMLVPSAVADLLGQASGSAVKVILCLIRFNKMPLSISDIATHCNIQSDDVLSALKFWTDKKILIKRGSLYHLCLESHALLATDLPKYSPNDILKRKEEDSSFAMIISEVERILGKILTNNDISIIYGIYDNLGFSADLILQLIGYCQSVNKTGFRYIEKVAIDWHDNGIDTFEKADSFIKQLEIKNKNENVIKLYFGIEGRALSKKESEYISSWFNVMKHSAQMIKNAFDVCVDKKGKMSFPYINSILEDWRKKGYKTPADIESAKIENKNPDKKGYDLDEFEKMAMKSLHGE